jgi:chemotaxis protein methyltransferase WspC
MSLAQNALPEPLLTLLRRRLGLEPKSLNYEHIKDQVSARARARNISNLEAYTAILTVDAEEMQKLAEALCVHETWFFRDAAPFHCLRHFVRNSWPQFGERVIRVLSVPCSTGEEAFSIAITLQDCGMLSNAICVEGVDISRAAIEVAERATYNAMSFRQMESEFAGYNDRFFRRSGEQWIMRDELRRLVRFRQGNLVDSGFLVDDEAYHVIFCRNLFIYFDELSRQRALQNLYRLLRPQGMLYIGHVEAAAFIDSRFAPYHGDFPFALRRDTGLGTGDLKSRSGVQFKMSPDSPSRTGPSLTQRTETGTGRSSGTLRAIPSPINPAKSSATNPIMAPAVEPVAKSTTSSGSIPAINKVSPQPPGTSAGPTTNEEPTLDTARRAADEGRLPDAANLCRAAILKHASAEGYALLGLISQAQGNLLEAERCYERTLYLEPSHSNALLQLALISERNGDLAKAENYRRRSLRSGNSGVSEHGS